LSARQASAGVTRWQGRCIMPRLSKEERAELEARLADDTDDDDDEVELGFADGSHFRGTFRRAQQVARARGFKLDPDPEPEGKPEGEGKVVKGTRFAGRRVS